MKLLSFLYYVCMYICLWIITSFGYSIFHKQFFYTSLTNIVNILLTLLIFFLFFFLVNRSKRNKIIGCILILCLSVFGICTYYPFLHIGSIPSIEKQIVKKILLPSNIQSNRVKGWSGDSIVAHSMGSIDGHRVVPSLETFTSNYEKGYRAFEVDFVQTSDDHLVCRHLWENPDLQKGIDEAHIPTLQQFKDTFILDQYTPMALTDLITLLVQYQDAWIVTDTKEKTNEEVIKNYQQIIKEANDAHATHVLQRFVIQVYDFEMYRTIVSMYPFQNIIYATYRDWHGDILSFVNICEFCNKNKINSISMWNYYYCDEIQEIADAFDLDVYVHTENDLSKAKQYLSMGAKGIYTDYILPKDLN